MSEKELICRIVNGQLLASITAHGPITKDNAMSAAKRIAGTIDHEFIRKTSKQMMPAEAEKRF